MCSNKTLFIKTGSGPDSACRLWCANPCFGAFGCPDRANLSSAGGIRMNFSPVWSCVILRLWPLRKKPPEFQIGLHRSFKNQGCPWRNHEASREVLQMQSTERQLTKMCPWTITSCHLGTASSTPGMFHRWRHIICPSGTCSLALHKGNWGSGGKWLFWGGCGTDKLGFHPGSTRPFLMKPPHPGLPSDPWEPQPATAGTIWRPVGKAPKPMLFLPSSQPGALRDLVVWTSAYPSMKGVCNLLWFSEILPGTRYYH